jgi:predicted RNase H-like HicB family nuclease
MDSKTILTQQFLHIRLWQEDGGYIAKCLDIPGCVSEGDTREEALANIQAAISSCLEVIREDGDDWMLEHPPVEIIERPMSDFIRVHAR